MKRSHDAFYLNEDNTSVKQSFVDVANEVACASFNTIADVGCATGAFPNYLKTRFPEAEITGLDYLESLLKKASKDFVSIKFVTGNVLDRGSVTQKFDVITMVGVLGIFDDYKLALENVLSWLNPKGRLILHNMVNEFDIDVFIKYKPSSINPDLESLESGWNIISLKSLNEVAKRNGAKVVSCKPFSLEVELSKQKDVMRSWTETNAAGGNDIFNALHVRQPQKIVTIEKH